MKGVSNMRKIINILKLVLYFVLGYFLFSLMISLVEFVLLNILSDEVTNFMKLFLKSLKGNLKIYTITYLSIFILNILYNFISIKKLNAKLDKIKKGWLLWKIRK